MLLASVVIGFLVTLIFMVGLRPVARSVGLVDLPGGRKTHVGEVPIIGGVAIFIGLLVGMMLLTADFPDPFYLLLAGSLLVAVGVLDDRYHLPPVVRFAGQISAVLLMVYGGGQYIADIGNPFGFGVIELGGFTLFVTILIAVSVINAFNFVDGIDGLAGTLGLIGLMPIPILAGYHSPAGGMALVAMAAVAGFLVFNYPTRYNRRVRTFMGDAGSTLVGFVVMWVTVSISQGPDAIATPVVCLWFAALPIFDLFTCFVRRIRRGRSPVRPGRDHLHHILSRAGFGVRAVLALMTGIALVYALIGLAGHYAGLPDVVMFTAWAVLGLSQHRLMSGFTSRYRLRQRRLRADQLAAKA